MGLIIHVGIRINIYSERATDDNGKGIWVASISKLGSAVYTYV